MIHLIDGTEWSFEDLERHNKDKADEVEKQKNIAKNKDWVDRNLGRIKVEDVGKPLK